jgi:transposase
MAIQNKRHGMLTYGVVLLHDTARPHTAACIRELLENFSWELFGQPPYTPYLTLSHYHVFIYLKNWLGSQHFSNNDELVEGVITWLSSLAAEFFDTGIQKLIPQYDECLNSSGDYIDK